MHTKLGATRAMFFASASALPMLRGPQVAYAPDDDTVAAGGGNDEIPEEFREQPGDREGDPEADPPAAEEDPQAGEDDPPAEEDPPAGEEDPPLAAEGDEDPPAGEEDPPARTKDWKDRQIAKLRAKQTADAADLKAANERAAAAEALLALPAEERDAAATESTREQIRKEEAVKLREENRYKAINTGLEKMDADGKKAFAKTWDARITEAREVFAEEMVKRPDFLEAVTDLPNSAAVYHELAGDPDKFEAVLAMPPHKMGMELARMSDRLAKPVTPRVSRAPAPITPLSTGGTERSLEEVANDPNESQEAFNRRMDAEERKREKAGR